jgi:curved DNA-binding protein CbpA
MRVMRANHPDRRPADAEAAERARRATAAWAVLRDADRRRAYDAARGAVRPRAAVARRTSPANAYSPEGQQYRRAFQAACYKVGAAVFALGLVLLLAVS